MEFIKKNWYKVLIILVLLILIIFTIPNISEAKGFIESAGGALWEPIQNFLVWIGDSVLNIMQNTFQTQQRVVVTAKSSAEIAGISLWNVLAIIGCIALVTVGAIFAWTGIGAFVAEASAATLVVLIKGVCIGVACGVASTYLAVKDVEDMSDKLSGEFDIPMIAYTPYAIFSNSIPALDINFINPQEDKTETTGTQVEENVELEIGNKHTTTTRN